MPERKQELAQSVHSEIETSIECYYRWWRIFGLTASSVTALSILSSFAAGICVANGAISNKLWASALAGLPALLLTIEQSFKFRDRSNWFWTLVLRYQSLRRALQRGELSDEEASRKIDDIEDQANANDPTISKSANARKGHDA
jgi:hypothetical protein